MKHTKQFIQIILVITMMFTSLNFAFAEDNEVPDDTVITAEQEENTENEEPSSSDIGQDIPAFEQGPILNDPLDYSLGLEIDSQEEIASGQLLNSTLRSKLKEDIESLLDFQPVELDNVNKFITSIDTFLAKGGYNYDSTSIGSGLLSTGELGQLASAIGLHETQDHLIEVIESNDNATGYIYVIDRNSIGVRVEDESGEGIGAALVTISYKDESGNTVTRSQYTTDGNLPGIAGFDKMTGVNYIMIDVQAENYRAQTILDKRITPGDILYFRLKESPENDVYLRCADLAGKDMLTEDTGLYLVETGSQPLDMRVIVTAKGNKSLPESITLKDDNKERSITTFKNHSKIDLGDTVSYMFTQSEDWLKKGGLLAQDDVLYFDIDGNKYLLPYVTVKNALMQPGTSQEELPLTGTDKEIPLTDIMGGSGIVSLTVNYLKVPVTIGVFPEGGFIIVATFDIESLSTSYSSLFEQSWNPKTRAETESVLEPFKQEFWRKADRFKSGTGQMNDSKRISLARDKYWSFNASFSLFCTGVYNEKTGNFDGSFGGIFDAKLSGGVTQYFLVSVPIVIPFYLGFNVFGEFKSALTANMVWNKLSDGIGAAFAAADHTLTQRYDLIAGLELYGGVGLKGICSIEAAGGAKIDFAAIQGTVEEKGKDGIRFLIDSFATVRVSGAIAFFSFNLFSHTFGPWRLYDSHPDKVANEPVSQSDDEIEFIDMDLASVNEDGTLLLAGDGETTLNHYKSNLLTSEVTTVNDIQTIKAISNDTFSDSQVQIVSTKKTTALFRIASIDGKAKIIYQKQNPETGEFMDDYYELPSLMNYDVTEFDVAASSGDDNLFYIGCIVADRDNTTIDSRTRTTRVQGIVVDLDNDSVRKAAVKSPLPDVGKYYYFNPRVAGSDGNIAVAYQKSSSYQYLGDAEACVFGTNEKEIVMGKGTIYTSGDIVNGEPSFFVTNRSHTTTDTLVIDGYMADGSFDENNPRCRFSVDVQGYKLSENENYLTNWGYANNTNYAIIASKLYFLEKYPNSYDQYGYGMRFTQVENGEGLVNRDNTYEFVATDDNSGICIVSTTTSYDVNMETGEHTLKGSNLKVYTLEGRYDSSTKTNQAILHGPLDIFVKNADICTFAAVFNRATCNSKGLSVVYASTPEVSLSADGKIITENDIYQWQQNLKRGMVATNVEFSDLFYYTDEHVLPVQITFRNIGYAIEGPVAFTIKDENGYDMHELYFNPGNKQWYDMGTEMEHNYGKLYSGDSVTVDLIVAAPYYWDANKIHEVRVEISPKYRGDAQTMLATPVYNNSLTLQGSQIVLGDKHYADLSITNINEEAMGLNKLAVEILYKDDTKQSSVSDIDLTHVTSDPDNDKHTVMYDLTPIWNRAEQDEVLAVRFYLIDEEGMPLTSEPVYMYPKALAELQDVSYEITEGADGIWQKGSDEDHMIKVVRSRNEETCFSHFTSVIIDDKELTLNTDYLAESGSTLITLKKEMMEQLAEGQHDVTITFDDGEVSTTLTIKAAEEEKDPDVPVDPTPVDPADPESPDTGDNSNLYLWVIMLLTSLTAMLLIVLRRKKYN